MAIFSMVVCDLVVAHRPLCACMSTLSTSSSGSLLLGALSNAARSARRCVVTPSYCVVAAPSYWPVVSYCRIRSTVHCVALQPDGARRVCVMIVVFVLVAGSESASLASSSTYAFVLLPLYIGFNREFGPDRVRKSGQAVSHIIERSSVDSRRRAELLFAREKHTIGNAIRS